jgi:type VII secretion effector (TIGR04197 family)
MIRIRTLLMYLGMCIVVALLVQQMVTTYYLAKIDVGLNSSLHSTSQLASIQQAIIDKNKALQDVVTTTKAMDGQLGVTLQTTQTIDVHIHRIDDLNVSTLKVNQGLVGLGQQSGSALTTTASSLQQFSESISKLKTYLSQLNQTIQSDVVNIHDMKAQTDTMNSKVPGVTR